MKFLKICILLLIACVFLLCDYSCNHKKVFPANDDEIKAEMNAILVHNILDIWYPKVIDSINGGFYSNFNNHWEKTSGKEKFIVSQSRNILTACKAADRFPSKKIYLLAAKHGYLYLRNVMHDNENGGFYSCMNCGEENDYYIVYKHSYGVSFALSALAAYWKISNDKDVLDLAKKTFYWLENHCHDKKNGGYYNFVTNKGDIFINNEIKVSKIEGRQSTLYLKEFNSMLHVLESLTELYKVWPDSLVKVRLLETLNIIRFKMPNKKNYMNVFYYPDWTPVSNFNDTIFFGANKEDFDYVTFGHDIQIAYLMLDASFALNLKDDTVTLTIAKKLVDNVLKTGFDNNYYGLFENGYYDTLSRKVLVTDSVKKWWTQAEALNGLMMFRKLYPDNKIYKTAFYNQWKYIKNNLIDYEYGDWYNFGLDKTPKAIEMSKVWIWKCNYHTSKALLNCTDWLNNSNMKLINHFIKR